VNSRNLITLALGIGLWLGLSGCGGHDYMAPPQTMEPPPPPPPPSTVTLAVADVLTKAKAVSETDDPLTVNDGSVTVTPVNDETSDPVSVD
jgi:hypothetical protein